METQWISNQTPDTSGTGIEVLERDFFMPSFAQESLWFLNQLEPESTAYNVYNPLLIKGPLNVQALHQSVNAVIQRHEILRTTFVARDGHPMQAVMDQGTIELRVIDLSGLDVPAADESRKALLSPLVFVSVNAPFDLEHGPLIHADVLRLAPNEHVLLITFHHIVADRWGAAIFWDELVTLYHAAVTGFPVALPELSIQYADFAEWQRETLQGAVLDEQFTYWRHQLEDAPQMLDLPTDAPFQAETPYAGGLQFLQLPEVLTKETRALALREGVTLFMLLFAAFQVLLMRYTGQEDIVTGTPVAGRTRKELEPLIGLFVNTLALRTDLSGDPSFSQFLQRVRETCLGAFEHQDLPFEKLIEDLHPDRLPGVHPLFQTFFVLQNAPGDTEKPWHDLVSESIFVASHENKFPLSLGFWDEPGGLKGDIEYDASLFTPETISRIIRHFTQLLAGLVAQPNRPISTIPLVAPDEAHHLMSLWRARVTAPAAAPNVPQMFARQATETPDAVALVWREQQITFAELDRRANQLARFLRRRGVGAETCVGMCLERGPEVAVALLGIFRSGGTYVPLDPKTLPERARFMLTDSHVPLLLTHTRLRDQFADLAIPLLCVDVLWPEISVEENTPWDGGAQPESAAYIIYTSGSTGTPKGVVVPHRALMDRILSISSRYELRPTDRLLQFVSLSFDVSLEEIFPTWIGGAAVVLLPEDGVPSLAEVSRMVRTHGLTVLDLPPSYWHEWVADLVHAQATIPPEVRLVVLGSEASSPAMLAEFERLAGDRVLWCNVYGLTETTLIAMTYGPSATGDWKRYSSIPIGRGLDNTRLYVLDARMQPAPIGVPGELYIGGPGLARGYMGRPDLTAERFLPDPFAADEPGARIYRTGDLARTLPNGLLEFMGRIDTQVKVRGFRIELGEIETVLRKYPGVREAVVLAIADEQDGRDATRLAAFVVTARQATALQTRLQRYLETQLPAYMVPSAVVLLQTLPRTAGGKADRRALALLLEHEEQRDGIDVAWQTPAERTLAEIWSMVLHLPAIGRNDNFFKLGGHSLQATQVVARLRDAFAVELPVRTMYDAPTLAALAEQLGQLQRLAERPPPIRAVVRFGDLPLSFAQQRLWFLDQLEPGSTLYTIPSALLLRGNLNVDVLARSLNALIQRHEPLRTTFPSVAGEPVQRIARSLTLPLPVVDLDAFPDPDLQEYLVRDLLTQEGRQPFDLARGPLMRMWLFRLSRTEHVLALALHHSVADGWSAGIVFRELRTLYAAILSGMPVTLPPLPVQYADYAVWQRQWLQGTVLENQLAYWKEQLSGAPAVLELAADFPRPPELTYRGAHQTFTIPGDLSQRLRALSQERGVTLFMVLLAAFQVLLLRSTGQEDLVVGTPIAGRQHRETEDLIGLFVNTLAIRTDLSGDPLFTDMLQRVRDVCIGAYAHQDIPFEKLVDALQSERNLSYTPIFQVLFALQHAIQDSTDLPGVTLASIEWASETAKFDLSVTITETGESLLGWIEYSTDLFAPETITRFAAHWQVLLEGIVANPQRTLSQLPILPTAEWQQMEAWNATTVPYPRDATIAQVFLHQAIATPDAIAVVCDEMHLSYATLLARSSQLAHYLRSLGVGPDVPVGLCLDRSVDLLPALLGIVLAGGAYVPLDPAYPPARLTLMLADAGAPLVLTQPHLHAPLLASGVPLLDVTELWNQVSGYPTTPPQVSGHALSLAYLCYTSGSTGIPKGVAIPQRAVLRLVLGATYATFGPDETFLHFAPLAFDAATLEVWGPLLTGGRLVIAPSGLVPLDVLGQVLIREGITTIWLTAGLFHLMVEDQLPALARVRHVLAGGDVLRPALVRRLLDAAPDHHTLTNGYGPTETTTFATCYAMTGATEIGATVPIGRPISNTTVYVLDAAMQPVPIGIAGELYIGGDGVARGYWGQPELTAERFVPHPWLMGERLYRTGDVVRWRADGVVEFLGRQDGQVKVRGYRIEVGEIERALEALAGVRGSVVVVREAAPGDKRLVGYVVGDGLKPQTIRQGLQQKLPSYLVPAAVVVVPALPLNANGKVDRAALPEPEEWEGGDEEREQALPQTPLEERLAAIWAGVLHLPHVGIHDNFFSLGGDSILSMQIIARARQAGMLVTPKQLFQYQTVAELAAVAQTAAGFSLAEQGPVSGSVPLTPIQHWFFEQDLADMQHYNQSMLLACPADVDLGALDAALRQMLWHHDALRLRFTRTASGWQPRNAGPGEDTPAFFTLEDLSSIPADDQPARINALATQAQTSINLERGPLLRAELFRRGAGQDGRLLIAIHHLAVDAVSWPILVEDLATAYELAHAGMSVQLPLKTTSFQRWAERLAAYAQSPEAVRHLDRWLTPARARMAPLPVDFVADPATNTEATARTAVMTLSQDETQALLKEVPNAYHTEINDALLAALGATLREWTGSSLALVDLEGHGRGDLLDEIDLSRTIGWFTAIFPVLLEIPDAGDPGVLLTAVKEQLRQIPDRGVGYGILRYLRHGDGVADRLRQMPMAQVSFNYLGQLDQRESGEDLFTPVNEPGGESFSARAQRRYLLDILGNVSGGQLRFTWVYSVAMHEPATVARLAERFGDHLRAIIAHCRSPQAGGHTPSDFPLARLDAERFRKLSQALNDEEE